MKSFRWYFQDYILNTFIPFCIRVWRNPSQVWSRNWLDSALETDGHNYNCKITFWSSVFNLYFVVSCCSVYFLQYLHNMWLLTTLLLVLNSARFKFTLKMRLNRKMIKIPNTCYIFEKLSVQRCQIWHSYVSIPFNWAPAHSTRPNNAKEALYVIISGEISDNLVHK